MLIAGFSFLAAFAALAYAVLLLARPQGAARQYGLAALCLALAAAEAVEIISLLDVRHGMLWRKADMVVESVLPGLFLLHSYHYSREQARLPVFAMAGLALTALFPVLALLQPPTWFAYSPDLRDEQLLFLTNPGFFFTTGMMAVYVWCLVNLEATYRSAARAERWRIRYHILGVGALLAVFCFCSSQGLLYRSISLQLTPLRSLFVVIAVACMVWSDLRSREQVRLQVSSHIAYRSAVIMAVGAYLVLLGLLGEGMKYLGGAHQRLLVTAFMFLLGMGLLLVLLSERVRRRVRVSIAKHFYANKYDYRIEWQKFTDRLSISGTTAELEQTILTVFAETFGLNGAALFVRDGEHAEYVCVRRYEFDEVSDRFDPSMPLVRYLQERLLVFNVAEDGRMLGGHADFFARHRIAFVVPLAGQHGLAGFIVLRGRLNDKEPVTYEDYDLMKALAQHACAALQNRYLAEELAEARELAAVAKLSTFVIHDLKNQVSGLSLLVQNAADYLDDPDFRQDMVRSVAGTVKRMQDLIGRLNDLREKRRLSLVPVELPGLVKDTVAPLQTERVTIEGSAVVAHADREELGKVILNLVLNGLESSSAGASVRIATGEADGWAVMRVADAGSGMSAEFMQNHLFRPFHTTKKQGLGIGLYQCRQIVEEHGGTIEVESSIGEGSVFTVRLPLYTK